MAGTVIGNENLFEIQHNNRLSFCNGEIWFFCAENKEIPVKISAAPEGENTGPLKGRRFVLREIISQ